MSERLGPEEDPSIVPQNIFFALTGIDHTEFWERIDEEIQAQLGEIDHMGRPKVNHVIGDNHDRHADNLSRYTGWYNGIYYRDGVPQNSKE